MERRRPRLGARRSRCRVFTADSAADGSLLTTYSAPIAVLASLSRVLDQARCYMPRDPQRSSSLPAQLNLTLPLFCRRTATYWVVRIPIQISFLRSIFLASILRPRCLAGTRASGLKVKRFSLRIWDL